MNRNKSILTQSLILSAVFQAIFTALGIPAGTATRLMDNPQIKEEVKAVRDSMIKIQKYAKDADKD